MAVPETIDPFENMICAPDTDEIDTELAIRKNDPYRDDTEEVIIRRYMESKYSVWTRLRRCDNLYRWGLYEHSLDRDEASNIAQILRDRPREDDWIRDACITIDGIDPNG